MFGMLSLSNGESDRASSSDLGEHRGLTQYIIALFGISKVRLPVPLTPHS